MKYNYLDITKKFTGDFRKTQDQNDSERVKKRKNFENYIVNQKK